MVDSGQVKMANHTWSHPYLDRLNLGAVADQISRNADFLTTTYGVDGTPFFRPPFGVYNADIDRVAADRGTLRSPCGAVTSGTRNRRTKTASSATPEIVSAPTDRDHPRQPAHHHPLLRPTARHHPQPQPANRDPQRRLRLISGSSRGSGAPAIRRCRAVPAPPSLPSASAV